jgi:hypothetical protein
MFVHCCHCTWCQRETGSAFALNALIETDRVEILTGKPVTVRTVSASGAGQDIVRCPECRVALWSHYGGLRDLMAFIRVGTLNDPAQCPPDIHIFTSTKLPWVELSDHVPVVAEYYRRSSFWPADSLKRWAALKERHDARG